MLLQAAILSRIVHLLVSVTLLGEESFENLISTLIVNELAANGFDSSRVRARSRVESEEALSSGLVWLPKCTGVEGWLL